MITPIRFEFISKAFKTYSPRRPTAELLSCQRALSWHPVLIEVITGCQLRARWHDSEVLSKSLTFNGSVMAVPRRPAACPRDPVSLKVAGSRGQAAGRRGGRALRDDDDENK